MVHNAQQRSGRHARRRGAGWAVRLASAVVACVAVTVGATVAEGDLRAAGVALRTHGWQDVSVGTQTRYCGFDVQAVQIAVYCQSGN
jgi:hypothetical protein